MSEMIPIEQVDHMIAEAVSLAVAKVRAQMQDALDQAKLTIRSLLAQIHGGRAETIQVVLSDEHQQHIDATWERDLHPLKMRSMNPGLRPRRGFGSDVLRDAPWPAWYRAPIRGDRWVDTAL